MINNSPGKLTFPHVRTTRLAAVILNAPTAMYVD